MNLLLELAPWYTNWRSTIILLFLLSNTIPLCAQGYYPLEEGNVWHYYVSGTPDTLYAYSDEAIGDTIMPNGLTYSQIRMKPSRRIQLLRQSGSQVFEHISRPDSPQVSSERLKFDFSKTDGDTVAVYVLPDDTLITTVLEVKNVLVFSRFLKQWTFSERTLVNPFLSILDICDSIGLKHLLFEPGEEYELLGAVIDGKSYGTLTSAHDLATRQTFFALSLSNYPNPFNSSTRITISNPTSEKAIVRIYNMLGQEVIELLNGDLSPGSRILAWAGLDQNGTPVSSGIYICFMRTQNTITTRKLILIR